MSGINIFYCILYSSNLEDEGPGDETDYPLIEHVEVGLILLVHQSFVSYGAGE